MDKVVRGELEEEPAPGKEAEKVEEKPVETAPVDMGEEPPIPEFILNIPNITAIDLCVSLAGLVLSLLPLLQAYADDVR